MKNLILICLMLLIGYSLRGQEAVSAYARGKNSYLLFAKQPYDSNRTYTIICFSRAGKMDQTSATLKQFANVVTCEWNTSADADIVLSPYNIRSKETSGGNLQLDGSDFSLNTTSPLAYLVLLDLKPQLLCCGDDCDSRLRNFFR
jgi:hypothetical protein